MKEGPEEHQGSAEVKSVGLIDFRIKAEYLTEVLGKVLAETGVRVDYYVNKYKGQAVGIELMVPSGSSDEDIKRVRASLEEHKAELASLTQQSIGEFEAQ